MAHLAGRTRTARAVLGRLRPGLAGTLALLAAARGLRARLAAERRHRKRVRGAAVAGPRLLVLLGCGTAAAGLAAVPRAAGLTGLRAGAGPVAVGGQPVVELVERGERGAGGQRGRLVTAVPAGLLAARAPAAGQRPGQRVVLRQVLLPRVAERPRAAQRAVRLRA
jgi:hypothetical protein